MVPFVSVHLFSHSLTNATFCAGDREIKAVPDLKFLPYRRGIKVFE